MYADPRPPPPPRRGHRRLLAAQAHRVRGGEIPHHGHRDVHEVLGVRLPPRQTALRGLRGARALGRERRLDGADRQSPRGRLEVHPREGGRVESRRRRRERERWQEREEGGEEGGGRNRCRLIFRLMRRFSGELSPSGRLHDVESKMFAHGDVFIRGDINLQ